MTTPESPKPQEETLVQSPMRRLLHFVALIAICIAGLWFYTGINPDAFSRPSKDAPATEAMPMGHQMPMETPMMNTVPNDTVSSNDDAVRGFMDAALILADVFRYTNNGSYQGLCEASTDHYTLEGESGGILKYVKFVGATEVFCTTSQAGYMIEVKLPESGMFYCIDSNGKAVEQQESREGEFQCV